MHFEVLFPLGRTVIVQVLDHELLNPASSKERRELAYSKARVEVMGQHWGDPITAYKTEK